jgi:hypothetical protein
MTLGELLTTISDAPICVVTYNHHSDDYRGVIYDRNIFIVQATGFYVDKYFYVTDDKSKLERLSLASFVMQMLFS